MIFRECFQECVVRNSHLGMDGILWLAWAFEWLEQCSMKAVFLGARGILNVRRAGKQCVAPLKIFENARWQTNRECDAHVKNNVEGESAV